MLAGLLGLLSLQCYTALERGYAQCIEASSTQQASDRPGPGRLYITGPGSMPGNEVNFSPSRDGKEIVLKE